MRGGAVSGNSGDGQHAFYFPIKQERAGRKVS